MQNPIGEADLEWILQRNCEGTEQLRIKEEMNEKAPLKCGVSGSGDFDLYCNFPVTEGTVELPGVRRADGYCAGKGLSERSENPRGTG